MPRHLLLIWLQQVKIVLGERFGVSSPSSKTVNLYGRVPTMPMKKLFAAAAAITAIAAATPASAAIYTYTMTNNSVLSINSDTQSATFKGADIDTSMTSAAFATFPGGALPVFTAVLSSLDGTRLINGKWITDNPKDVNTTHPQKLILEGKDVNLWAWWGNPIIGGDYLTKIKSYTVTPSPVPEPGMMGILAVGLTGLAFARRKRRQAAIAA